MSSVSIFDKLNRNAQSRSLIERGFVTLAVLFQLASAQTTFTGAEEFLTRSFFLAAILTFVVQAGLVLSGERLVEILSGRQKKHTSIIPALLLLLLTFSTSVVFSGFGFYKHYAYAEGNRTSEFTSTAAEIKQTASELEQYRADALSFAASKSRGLEDERRRQEARANSNKLSSRSRGTARSKRDQLSREINMFTNLQNTLGEVNVIASASKPTPEQMRQSLIDARNKITQAVSQAAPDYLNDNPMPSDIPTAAPPTDVQSGFKRDLQQRRPPAVFSLVMAGMVDLASLLCLLCNIYVSPTEERILNAKRKIKRTWNAALPLRDTQDTFSVVRMRVQGLKERSEFQVVFKKPDWALLGSDLEVNRAAVNETLNQHLDEHIVVRGFYTANGERIIPERLLFEQLGCVDIVYVHTGQASDSGWPEMISDDGTN